MASKSTVSIGNAMVGEGNPCFLIAEVGTTTLGELERCMKLIDAADSAGMDAVKFQLIDPEQLSDKSAEASYQVRGQKYSVNMYDIFSTLRFSRSDLRALFQSAEEKGLEFFATVDFLEGVQILEDVGVNAYKIGAWDCTYRQLIELIGQTGKPLFVDLGPATKDETEQIVDWYMATGGSSVLFMHDYHTEEPSQMNIRAIEWLNERFEWPAGFSSPDRNNDVDIVALSMGAHHIEKRLILDRNTHALHAHQSLEPDELRDWVGRIRWLEKVIGSAAIIPSDFDLAEKTKHYRSACTLTPVSKGQTYSPANLGAKRPGTGIPAKELEQVWGKKAARDLPANSLIASSDIT